MIGARMGADMAAQPDVLRRLVERRRRHPRRVRVALLPPAIVIVARGSSDYAAVFGRYLLEAATGRPVALAAPSLQTLYGVEPRLDGWLALGISQSGRTPEITTVLERYRLGGRADGRADERSRRARWRPRRTSMFALDAGDEEAVPATKTFTAELAAVAMIAEALGPVPWDARDLGAHSAAWSRAVLDDSGSRPSARPRCSVTRASSSPLRRGFLMCVALEAALKLREASGVRAEGWSAADFRHGPVTAARGELPLLAVSATGPAAADVDELAGELARAGTPVLRLADRSGAELPYPPGLPEPLCVLPASVRAQQLALALALRRGIDPDHPPGLHKITATT